MLLTGVLTHAVQGYFIESLLYNLPDTTFEYATYRQTVLELLAKLWNDIREGRHENWVEVNGLKWLWRGGQSWTPQEAADFAYAGWNYVKSG